MPIMAIDTEFQQEVSKLQTFLQLYFCSVVVNIVIVLDYSIKIKRP